MNTQKHLALVALCGALGLLAGCASEPESHLVTAPPPPAPGTAPAPQVVVVTQPQAQQVVAVTAMPAGVNSYVVMQAPPAPQAAPEAIPDRPTSQHVWLAGYWTWQNNRYAWMAGHWEVPPSNGATWVNPRWVPEGGAFRFYEGHWN